eukprot:3760905-Pleurochrysis_carterae.AAC.1
MENVLSSPSSRQHKCRISMLDDGAISALENCHHGREAISHHAIHQETREQKIFASNALVRPIS